MRPPWARRHGYTVVELVVVMSLVAILAASVLPKFTSATGMRDQAWRDQVVAAARAARGAATSHRRVVCLSFSGNSVSLTIAHLNPGTACTTTMTSPTGSTVFATSDNSSGTTTVTQGGASYGGALYFQPDGRVTTDYAGTTAGQWTVVVAGTDSILIDGVTGYAR